MSLVVPCTGCPAKLSAPESAAGKRLRCPKCKAVVPVPTFVPAEEVPVVEAKLAPETSPQPAVTGTGDADENDSPKKKLRRAERDEDEGGERPRKKKKRPVYDQDDEGDRPRKKARKPAKGGRGGAIFALVAVGGLLLLGGAGFGIYLLVSQGGLFAKKAPAPAGWTEYRYPQAGFKAYFPREPQNTLNITRGTPGHFNPPRNRFGWFGGEADLRDQADLLAIFTTEGQVDGRSDGAIVVVQIVHFGSGVPPHVRNKVDQINNTKWDDLETRHIRWLGSATCELSGNDGLARIVCTDRLVLLAFITGANGRRAKPEEEAGFFDNFELIK